MKNLFILSSILIVLILSCTALPKTGFAFDDSIPEEKTARLSTDGLGKIIGYNGITVNWETRGTKFLQIPAGNTLLEWDIYTRVANTMYTGKNMKFQYNFLPQKNYIFMLRYSDGKYGLTVYEFDYEEKIKAGWKFFNAHLAGFVPFLNQNEQVILK